MGGLDGPQGLDVAEVAAAQPCVRLARHTRLRVQGSGRSLRAAAPRRWRALSCAGSVQRFERVSSRQPPAHPLKELMPGAPRQR